MTFASSIQYIGDPPGRKVGDIFYGIAAPDVSYVATTGAQVLASDYGSLQLAGWPILSNVGLVFADSSFSSSVGPSSVVGTEAYFSFQNSFNISKKTSPTADPVTARTDPLGISGGNYTQQYYGFVASRHFVSYQYDDGAGTQFSGFGFSPPNTVSGVWGHLDSSLGTDPGGAPSSLWAVSQSPTGRMLYGTSNNIFYGPTDGSIGSLTRVLSTGVSGKGWGSFFVVGSTVYAASSLGAWAKSTDGGVTWTVATPFNGAIGLYKAVYDPNSAKFYGVDTSNDVVSAVDPMSAWTTEVSSASNFQYSFVLVTALGNVVVVAPDRIAVKGRNQTYFVTEVFSAGSLVQMYGSQFGGYILLTRGRSQLIGDVDTRFNLPKIPSYDGLTAYIKARP